MRKAIKASSIIETIIAMVIIVIIYGIVLNFYLGQSKKSHQYNMLNIHFELKKYIETDIKEGNFEANEFRINSFIIEKTVSNHEGFENVILIKYMCKDNNRTIAEKKKIVIKY